MEDDWGHFDSDEEEPVKSEHRYASERFSTCCRSLSVSDLRCLDKPQRRKSCPPAPEVQKIRVRKRRDDFCGERKSAKWDVERWYFSDLVLSPAFQPRTATRFFSDRKGITVSFTMGSIRIVAGGLERYAQYEIVVTVDGRTTSTWRRYSAFRALVASVSAESAPRNIVRTLSAWADAQDAKRIFRCTHPAYLIQRYYHFEHVLREALFELTNPRLLLDFFEPDDDDDDDDNASHLSTPMRNTNDSSPARGSPLLNRAALCLGVARRPFTDHAFLNNSVKCH